MGARAYIARYVTAFGAQALKGLRIGVYQHSSVARDIMVEVVTALGGTPVALARSDHFIPVDTEALDDTTRDLLAGWITEHGLQAIISTDGDADRPILVDHAGSVVPGDVLGALSAKILGANAICTPISSNTICHDMGFDTVDLTRIGSPYVIAAMNSVLQQDPAREVVGYETNGGVFLGFTARGPAGVLSPLMTRDGLLSFLAPLAESVAQDTDLVALQASLVPRFTATDRLPRIESHLSQKFLSEMTQNRAARFALFSRIGTETHLDLTDGLRMTFENGDVIHLRASGNAPELRCYAEASTRARPKPWFCIA